MAPRPLDCESVDVGRVRRLRGGVESGHGRQGVRHVGHRHQTDTRRIGVSRSQRLGQPRRRLAEPVEVVVLAHDQEHGGLAAPGDLVGAGHEVQRRTPGQRAGLTRPAVLAAARELLAAGGLEALTMRALADRLHVAPNALYSHVAGKTALIDELLDELLALVEAPPEDVADPRAGLHRVMASTYDVRLAHADLVPLYLARQGARGPTPSAWATP